MSGLKFLALFLGLWTLTACSGVENIGRAPGMTAIGADGRTIPDLVPGSENASYFHPVAYERGEAEGSLWRSGPESLFGDRRARVTGDILTIVIEIDDEAEINNSSDRSRSGSEAMSVPSLLGLPQLIDPHLPDGASMDEAAGLTSSASASGEGSIRRNEKLMLRVAATVTEVLPNGNLVVQGNQEVRVNFELRDLQVAGIVRPEDISRRNEITYDKIAGARISYGGRGQITDVQQPRYGQQFLDHVLPF
jgi:flagellar L-ring protein FlgH